MGKVTLHCIRHAQGYHNLSNANHSIRDPLLTPFGKEQCVTLSKTFPHPERITHFVSSPMRRTLYTTLLSFPSVFAPSTRSAKRILALPEAQETSDLPCDTGSPVSFLEREFNLNEKKVDFTRVGKDWNSKTGKWSPASSAIEARAREARIFLHSLALSAQKKGVEDVQIVLVTHGGFLHYFTEDWDGALGSVGTGWSNTEFRTYDFVAEDSVRETRESRERRRGTERELSKDEQRELRAAAEREWGLAGFQTPDGGTPNGDGVRTPVEAEVEEVARLQMVF